MERSRPLPVMEGASDAHNGEERAHAMERSDVSWGKRNASVLNDGE
jgi:hypothetical protein